MWDINFYFRKWQEMLEVYYRGKFYHVSEESIGQRCKSVREWKLFIICREGKNFVFWFGAQFNSTLNFTQSGWLILFSPELHFRPPNLVSCQTQSLWQENADQCRRHTGRSSIAMLFGWTMPLSAEASLWL